jgi:hypothetical protein
MLLPQALKTELVIAKLRFKFEKTECLLSLIKNNEVFILFEHLKRELLF